MKKVIAIFLACIVLLAAGCGNSGPTLAQAAKWDDTVVANWDGAALTMTDYIFFLWSSRIDTELQAIYNGSYSEENVRELWRHDDGHGHNMEEHLREDVLRDALHFATLYKLAVDAGAELTPQDIEATAEAIGYYMGDMSPEEFMMEHGVTPGQMETIYNKMDLINIYLFEVSTKAAFTDKEIADTYNENKDRFERVRVRHVLIGNESRTDAEAKELAEDVLAQIRDDADIGEMAAQYSDDPGSKDSDGEYTFGRGRMLEPFEAWAFSANVGDTGIVETDYGFHVMQLMDRYGLDYAKDDVKDYLGDMIASQIIEDAFDIAAANWIVDEAAVANAPMYHD